MNWYLIRHLPTSWNQRRILQGKKDIGILPPTAEVLEAVQSNKAVLDAVVFDYVLTSQYKRTRETATLYGYSPGRPEPLLNELDFGPYEGQPKDKLIAETSPSWQENALELTLGEPLSGFQDRLFELLKKYRHCDKLLAFGHGAVTRGLLAIHRYGNIARMNAFEVPNNKLIILKF